NDEINGVNFVVRRAALQDAGAFLPDIRVGGDYHLAARLIGAGHQIRTVAASEVETEYSTDPIAYVRQNARWQRSAIRNRLRFGKEGQLLNLLMGSVAGLIGVSMPVLSLFWGWRAWYVWFLVCGPHIATRWKYYAFSRRQESLPRAAIVYTFAFVF